jgi:predicted ester cyclase
MAAEKNLETVRRIQEAWNQGRLDDLDQYFASGFDNSQNTPPGMPGGIAGAKAAAGFAAQAFADRKVETIAMFADDENVFVRNRVTGKNVGGVPWLGIPANGRTFDMESWSVYTFGPDGKVVRHLGLNDMMSMRRQLMEEPQPA